MLGAERPLLLVMHMILRDISNSRLGWLPLELEG